MTYICYPHENFLLPYRLMLLLRTNLGWRAFKVIFFVIGAHGSPPQLIFQLSEGWHSKRRGGLMVSALNCEAGGPVSNEIKHYFSQ